MSFVHFRTLSSASFGEGALRPEEIVSFAGEHNMPAIALTDIGNFFQASTFARLAVTAGIQPINGAMLEIDFADFLSASSLSDAGGIGDFSAFATLIPLTSDGWLGLSHMASEAWLSGENGGAIKFQDLLGLSRDILLLSGACTGPIGKALALGREDLADKITSNLLESFKDNFVFEIVRQDGITSEAQQVLRDTYQQYASHMAQKHSLMAIAACHASYLDKDFMAAHAALRCITARLKIDDEDAPGSSGDFRIKTPDEMREIYADQPALVDNTMELARRVRFCLEPSYTPKMPHFPVPKGQDAAGYLAQKARAGLDDILKAIELEKTARRKQDKANKLQVKQGSVLPASMAMSSELAIEDKDVTRSRYLARLDEELGIIDKVGYNGYFLIVADFVSFAKSQGIPVGPGRGSGAASLVAWCMGITGLDPLRSDLLFERFINPERKSPPDFDIDFCQYRRDEVIRYVVDKYGEDHVAHIITIGRMQARAVVRDVGRVLGLGYSEVDRIAKMIPEGPPTKEAQLPALLGFEVGANAELIDQKASQAKAPELRNFFDTNESVADLLRIAIKLEGLFRNASRHAAGVVISDRPLDERVPLMREQDEKNKRSDKDKAGDKVKEGANQVASNGRGAKDDKFEDAKQMPITQFDMDSLADAGLLKFDFLGLTTLSIIDFATKMIASGGVKLDLESIPLDDDDTFKMLRDGDVVGVFQLESDGMRRLVMDLECDSLDDIVACVALFRPGPMQNIGQFTASKLGHEKVKYLHPLLKPILEVTHGIPVYQEQVLRMAQSLGGYSLAGADLLRRAMGKKIKEEMQSQRKIFIAGASKHGISKGVAGDIFQMMETFAGYGFNKAHAASYALISYRTAWLKRHYPSEFLAASMTVASNETDRLAQIVHDARRLGIRVLGPDVNSGSDSFSVERIEGKNKGESSLAIRYSMAGLKGVGRRYVEDLCEERKQNGAFKSLSDLFLRAIGIGFPDRMLEILATAGAMDSLEPNRARVVDNISSLVAFAKNNKRDFSTGQTSLFGSGSMGSGSMGGSGTLGGSSEGGQMAGGQIDSIAPDVVPWTSSLIQKVEIPTFGYYFSEHPLKKYNRELKVRSVVSSADLGEVKDGVDNATMAGVISKVTMTRSARGRTMLIARFSDQLGEFRCYLFDEEAHEKRTLLEGFRDNQTPLLISVAIRRLGGEIRSLSLARARPIDGVSSRIDRYLEVFVTADGVPFDLKSFRKIIGASYPERRDGVNLVRVRVRVLEGGKDCLLLLPGYYRVSHDEHQSLRRVKGVVRMAEGSD